jgi:D-xylose transport system permease protein
MSVDATTTVDAEPTGLGSVPRRIWDNLRTGNLGPAPVLFALVVIVAYFSQTAPNFFSANNFNNIITQMAGTTLLAFGVVFVLLIGEIDLSVAYVSGLCAVVAAEAQLPDGANLPGLVAILLAVLVGVAIGAFQGSFVALIGVPSFVVTLAGFLMWQGAIIKIVEERGAIIIQDSWINNTANYFFSHKSGWIIAVILCVVYVIAVLSGLFANLRHGIRPRDPLIFGIRLILPPLLILLVVYICNQDERRGVPLALLIMLVALFVLTFLAKRTTFGRHVYAVGGNAEAARRAGINVARVRILVFMIAGMMSAIGGIVLAARLNSVDLNQGGGTLLIDAIAAAVIGGTSLFGGRGEVRNALFGALVIKTIENGLDTKGYSQGVIFIVTGGILLFAVTIDAIARRLQVRSGR